MSGHELVPAAAALLVAFLPFLLSLIGKASMARMLCLVTSILTLLLSVSPYVAALPWFAGMLVAAVAIRARWSERAVH